MKKFFTGLAVAAGVAAASSPAFADIVIDNINFGTGLPILTTENLAQQYINPFTTAPGTGEGWGYGRVSDVNGAAPGSGGASYCATGSCALYYTVHYYGGTFSPIGGGLTAAAFTGTDVTIYYYSGVPVNLQNQDSLTNMSFIQGLTALATLKGHGNLGSGLDPSIVSYSFGSLSGGNLHLTGTGLLDVNFDDSIGDAAFEKYLAGQSAPDAAGKWADFLYNESAGNRVQNANDIAAGLTKGCFDGTAATGAWCWQGTSDLQGFGVLPEPDSLALLSLSLILGGAVTQRRRRS